MAMNSKGERKMFNEDINSEDGLIPSELREEQLKTIRGGLVVIAMIAGPLAILASAFDPNGKCGPLTSE